MGGRGRAGRGGAERAAPPLARGVAQSSRSESARQTAWRVATRATRQWTDEQKVIEWAYKNKIDDATEVKLKSPAQLEKVVKKFNMELPSELVTAISSGSTLVPDTDPRPAVLNLGQTLARITKLQ